jgi:transcription antitermination factor NusG
MLDIPAGGARQCHIPDEVAPIGGLAPCVAQPDSGESIKFGHGGARIGAGRPRKLPPLEPWTGPRWCVYQTHPQAERLAAHELSRAGYRSYLPLIAVKRRDPVIPTMFHKVLVTRFRGYGFVELGPAQPWIPIREAAGVLRVLLTNSGRPAPVRFGDIEWQMAQDDKLCDLKADVLPEFDPGIRVRVEDGPFTSFSGTVIECDGMVTLVEVEMFGRLIPVRLARTMVAELQDVAAAA